MDTDGDGVVTREELKNLMKKGLGEEYSDDIVEEMIKSADSNNDGMIQFNEFLKVTTDTDEIEEEEQPAIQFEEKEIEPETMKKGFNT